MAKLESPLYGTEATGTLARALAYRTTTDWNIVAKIPAPGAPPSTAQTARRQLFLDAVAAWHALTPEQHNFYQNNHPGNLTGYLFFIKLWLKEDLAYFGYCIFYRVVFQLAPSPDQPIETEYDKLFPTSPDEFPTIANGAHSPQAWLFNTAYDSIAQIQDYLILNKTSIEGG